MAPTFEQLIADQQPPELVSGCMDNVALIRDPQVPAQMKDVALEQLALRLRRLGMLVDAAEILEAPPCR